MPTATFISSGDTIEYTVSRDIAAGDVINLGTMLGVVIKDTAAYAPAALNVRGMYDLPKAAESITRADPMYWDGDQITATASGNTLAGKAAADAAAGDATVRVVLTP